MNHLVRETRRRVDRGEALEPTRSVARLLDELTTCADLGRLVGLERARGQLEKALETLSGMNNRVKEILYNLGVIAERMDDLEGARGYFARIYEADIAFRDVAQKMERLSAG